MCTVFTALLTFTVTTLYDRKVFKAMLQESMVNHEKQMHQATMLSLIEKHEENCAARNDLIPIKMALAFLVAKQPDGDPKRLGLI